MKFDLVGLYLILVHSIFEKHYFKSENCKYYLIIFLLPFRNQMTMNPKWRLTIRCPKNKEPET